MRGTPTIASQEHEVFFDLSLTFVQVRGLVIKKTIGFVKCILSFMTITPMRVYRSLVEWVA